ncbi:MAG: 3-hydroxy acid dehydrogenase/malonic semialdehyde reductase [Flavobacteriales bacterium]|jgi:3-hydroxy acid dehydrogenase/malonic semialdehyde reductase
MKIVLVTGATSGIGKATAQKFAAHKHNLIITGRRKERLVALADSLETEFNIKVLPLVFDVRNKEEVSKAISSLNEDWNKIDILVNNAGLALGRGTIDNGDLGDWDTMIDTNVKGLLYMCKAVIPLLKKSATPHIINIGSIAGKETYLAGNVYCATKHAVDALTKAMRIDLLPHAIKVTGVCPGAVETEFSVVRYHGDQQKANDVYNGFKPLEAEDVAEVIFFAASQPKHVNLNDIVITPTAQANTVYIAKEL